MKDPEWNFSTFDEWWDAVGKYNAYASTSRRELMKLAWEVARELKTPSAFDTLPDDYEAPH